MSEQRKWPSVGFCMTVVVILTAFVTTEWYVALCNRTVTPEPVPVPQVRNQPDDGWCTG